MSTEQPQTARGEQVRAAFNDYASTYDEWYQGRNIRSHSFNWRRRRVYEVFPEEVPEGAVALDIGCGPGLTIKELLGRGYEVHGIDIAEDMVDICKQRFGDEPKAHFAKGAIEALPFDEGSLDLILCMGVVEYLEDDDAAIREMARCLKPGGAVIITCPNFWSPWRRWSKLFHGSKTLAKKLLGREVPTPLFHREYRESKFRRRLATHGLEAVDMCAYNFKVIPEPFDKRLEGLSVSLSEKLERLARSPLRFLATGFNAKAVKR